MELRQLRYYKAVAELLNFSRASEQLHVAQSALSRQIQALEEDIGVKLLDRDRSRVSLTEAGRVFYHHTCKLLLQVEVAVTDAQQTARGSSGEFVVCTDWRLDARFVSESVEEFREKHPRVDVTLRHAGNTEQIALIRSRQAHLGFVVREIIGKNSEIEFLPIQQVYINAILPVSHPFAKHKIVHLYDLAKERWLDVSEKEAGGFRAYFIQQCRLSGYTPRIVKTASSLDELFGYVASGYGITAAPAHLRPRPGVPVCCVRTDCPPIEFCAVWRSPDASPLLPEFMTILKRKIPSAQVDH